MRVLSLRQDLGCHPLDGGHLPVRQSVVLLGVEVPAEAPVPDTDQEILVDTGEEEEEEEGGEGEKDRGGRGVGG